jgi:hypothetical protein
MKLNLATWKPEDVRFSSKGIQYKIMDLDSQDYRWLTAMEIEKICDSDGSRFGKLYRGFKEKIDKRAVEISGLKKNGFMKKIIEKYYEDNKMKFCIAEIIQTYYPNDSGIPSAPELLVKINKNNFHYKKDGLLGIDKEILNLAKRSNAEDIHLVDEYSGMHFITTLDKYEKIGETENWGKVYLPVKHFTVYQFGGKYPDYQKHLNGIDIHENNRRD